MGDMKSTEMGTLTLYLKVTREGKSLNSGDSPKTDFTIIESFSMGASLGWNPKDPGPAGSINISSLSVSRRVSPSTAEYFKSLLDEANITVDLEGHQKSGGATAKPEKVFGITLKDARCTSVQLSGSNENIIVESASFDAVTTSLQIGPSAAKKIAEWDWKKAKQ